MKYKLYKHQIDFLQKNPNKSLLCWDTGTGKTIAALEWAQQKNTSTLIVVPKSLKKNWTRNKDNAQHEWGREAGKEIKIFIVTKEEFRRSWCHLPKYDTLIIDEAHYFAGMRNSKSVSEMAKSLYLYIKKHKVPNILLLTATPYLSTPWNIYMLAKHLGRKWNYREFKNRFFEDIYIGIRIVPKIKEGIEDEIAALVGGMGDVVKLEECIDVPDQIFEIEKFSLTKEQVNKKKEVLDLNPIVRYTRYHQIENGTLKSDGYTKNEFIKCDKNERIFDLCEQTKKIAIICRYNLQIDYLRDLLPKIGKPVYVIRGDVKDRQEVIDKMEKAEKGIILINASCSEGYELPSIGLIVFASLSFSYKDYKQVIGRFLRINHPKKNVYLHLISDGTDEDVYKAIISKKDFDIKIYDR